MLMNEIPLRDEVNKKRPQQQQLRRTFISASLELLPRVCPVIIHPGHFHSRARRSLSRLSRARGTSEEREPELDYPLGTGVVGGLRGGGKLEKHGGVVAVSGDGHDSDPRAVDGGCQPSRRSEKSEGDTYDVVVVNL